MSTDVRNQLAVALHYDKTGAPRVTAKGKGVIGAKIIEIAKAHDIPIEENECWRAHCPMSNSATKSRRTSTRQWPKSDFRASAVGRIR